MAERDFTEIFFSLYNLARYQNGCQILKNECKISFRLAGMARQLLLRGV